MSKRLSVTFVVLAIIFSVISFAFVKPLQQQCHSYNKYAIGTALFNDLKVNDIKGIKIIQPNTNTIVLHEKSSKWSIKNLYNYPADTNKISNLLQEVINLKVIQNVRITPNAYKQLNLS